MGQLLQEVGDHAVVLGACVAVASKLPTPLDEDLELEATENPSVKFIVSATQTTATCDKKLISLICGLLWLNQLNFTGQ